MSIRAISEQSGLSKSVIGRILYGRTSQNLPPAKYIDGTTAEAILATQFRHSLKALVDATGTKRRIQALARIGYSVNEQARLMGRDPANLSHTLHVDETWASTRYAVAELYDKLQNRPRNGTSKGERISINRTRSYARQNGWLPPAAWDEDRMDDPEHKGYPEAVAA